MDIKEWKVESTSDSKKLKTVVEEIDSALQGDSGIKLDPEYQREYKFTQADESLLIESLLMNIPIPVIYLSSNINSVPYIANVIDGQHRLRAVYRFLKDKFALKGLEIYSYLNDHKFSQLPDGIKNKLLHQSRLAFENIHVQDNPDLEIEIFKRYNKGTHPLSRQELRHTMYICRYNMWLNNKIEEFYKDALLGEFYNITKKRYSDKSAHESICVMLSILSYGLNSKYSTSPEYADTFLEAGSKNKEQQELIDKSDDLLYYMNRFLMEIYNRYNIKYPFSKEIYGVESRNYKLQIPILMLISAFIKYLRDNDIEICNEYMIKKVMESIKLSLSNSYLEEDFKGSNTRPSILQETLDIMIKNFKEMI